MKNIRNILCKTFGFTIIGHGYRHRHYTLSFKEATQWAACYADGADVYKRGIWVASKMQG